MRTDRKSKEILYRFSHLSVAIRVIRGEILFSARFVSIHRSKQKFGVE